MLDQVDPVRDTPSLATICLASLGWQPRTTRRGALSELAGPGGPTHVGPGDCQLKVKASAQTTPTRELTPQLTQVGIASLRAARRSTQMAAQSPLRPTRMATRIATRMATRMRIGDLDAHWRLGWRLRCVLATQMCIGDPYGDSDAQHWLLRWRLGWHCARIRRDGAGARKGFDDSEDGQTACQCP